MKVARIECAEYPRSNPSVAAYFAHDAVNGVGVHASALLLALAIVLERPEQRPIAVTGVPGGVEIGAQPRCGLRVYRQCVASPALAYDAQRVIAAVLVQIAGLERRNLGAPQPDLQSDRQDGAVAQPSNRVLRRHVEQFARLHLREGEGRAFVAIDRRPLDLADGIARGVAVPHQMLVERRQCREPAGGSSTTRRARSRA